MMLKENNTLKKLDLTKCGLQPEGLEEVIKGVQVNTKLESLHLSENTIDAKRASCLGKNTGTMTFHTHIHQLVMPGWDTIITCTTGPSHLPPPHTSPHPSQCNPIHCDHLSTCILVGLKYGPLEGGLTITKRSCDF